MKFLIIGCGSIGCRHARLAMETGKYAVALCDQDTGRLNAIADELGITETYTDMDEAIRLTDAEAVIVTASWARWSPPASPSPLPKR